MPRWLDQLEAGGGLRPNRFGTYDGGRERPGPTSEAFAHANLNVVVFNLEGTAHRHRGRPGESICKSTQVSSHGVCHFPDPKRETLICAQAF